MRITPALFVLLLAATPAMAQSNIGLTDYPAPKCDVPPPVDEALRPEPPNRGAAPPDWSGTRQSADNLNAGEAALYNVKVRAYNRAMRAHNDGVKSYAGCVQGYMMAGKADIQRIQAAVDAAVASANGRVPVLIPVAAAAQSNITLTQYPAPKCDAPPPVDPATRPAAPSHTLSVEEAALYNAKTRAYNAALQAHNEGATAYSGCVQGYVMAGKADILRIQAAIDTVEAIANGR